MLDDDAFMLDVLEELLGQLGVVEIGSARDARVALAALDAATLPWEVIVCDLNLPGMDGIEFARHIAARGFRGGVVLLSGADRRLAETVGYLIRAHGLRFLGAIAKPIALDALHACLERLSAPERSPRSTKSEEPLSVDTLADGLARGGCVEAWFQPKISATNRRVQGAEALVRWRDAERGILPPSTFVRVAEDHGLIDALTFEVFQQTMVHSRTWASAGHRLKVSVNLAMGTLSRLDLPDTFDALARAAGVDPASVVLELTEHRMVSDVSAAIEVLTRLRLKGFGLSIDDFGSGYASLGMLKLLPFSELKVDRAFVHGASDDVAARAILESSVRLGAALGMNVVAEGAETADDVALATRLGCDEIQGYAVARPMPGGNVPAWTTRWERT
jgi:EAL domain-containing protein (putative c-di-GMP-specific phosphodiesterase class I)